jgi:hypothetical protein
MWKRPPNQDGLEYPILLRVLPAPAAFPAITEQADGTDAY